MGNGSVAAHRRAEAVNRLCRGALLAAAAAAAGGCAAKLPVVENLADVGADKVIVVGRVSLTPPLRVDEQHFAEWHVRQGHTAKGKPAPIFETNLDRFDEGNFTWLTRETSEPVADIRAYHYLDVIREPIDGLFFVAVPRTNLHVVRGEIVMEKRTGGYKHAIVLPTQFAFDVREADRAIYIGTVHYERNEFYQIIKTRIEDDYDKARAEFRAKFGDGVKLRKALVKRPG